MVKFVRVPILNLPILNIPILNLYELIPVHNDGPVIPWVTVEQNLRQAFKKPTSANYFNSYGKEERIEAMVKVINKSHEGVVIRYATERFLPYTKYFNQSVISCE